MHHFVRLVAPKLCPNNNFARLVAPPVKKSLRKIASGASNFSSFPKIKRCFYGATYALNEISAKIGLLEDLKKCLNSEYKKFLSIVFYLILGGNRALMNFNYWASNHDHHYGDNISSQDSSRLFASITDEQVNNFFKLQAKRRIENEYWAYDSTSISSYSESLNQIKYGKNKEDDKLPQMNLLLLYGEKSGLPFYYCKLSGNIPDVKTVNTLIKELNILGYPKIKLVMDRGFYSKENINQLYLKNHKFIVGVSCDLSFVKDKIDEVRNSINDYKNYNISTGLGMTTTVINWEYAKNKTRKMYLHIYHNAQKAIDAEQDFNNKIYELEQELISGKRNEKHEKDYERFFEVTTNRKKQTIVKVKEDVIKEAKKNFGYFALVSNEIKIANLAICLYRNKDVVEKAFGNLKERLNCRRFLVSSEASLNGKLFTEFVALILLSYIHKQMQEKELYKDYTLEQVLMELDSIQSFCEIGRSPIIGEVLEKQKKIYEALDIEIPR